MHIYILSPAGPPALLGQGVLERLYTLRSIGSKLSYSGAYRFPSSGPRFVAKFLELDPKFLEVFAP